MKRRNNVHILQRENLKAHNQYYPRFIALYKTRLFRMDNQNYSEI